MSFAMHFCTICGREKTQPDWFLIAVNQWGDKLTILDWNNRVASLKGVQEVCGSRHARELVIHWMKSGTLDFPPNRPPHVGGRAAEKVNGRNNFDFSGARQLGELYLHRESIDKILVQNPESAAAIVDELLVAMNPQPYGQKFSETCAANPGIKGPNYHAAVVP